MKGVSLLRKITVALRKESVDRNVGASEGADFEHVALRKESVDRNDIRHTTSPRPSIVALRKESVDRNEFYNSHVKEQGTSLSARRAWIEIPFKQIINLKAIVALRKESVDRNVISRSNGYRHYSSLSARRAWIEMSTRSQPSKPKACRSPQGERG